MVRPCVARGFFRSSGERSCINVSGLGLELVGLPAIMDISARAISLADRPRSGHLGHQCSHAPGRPNLHFVSSSRRPRREGKAATSSHAPHLRSSFVRAESRSFVPARASSTAPRAGAVKAGRRDDLTSCSGDARPHLDGPERGARIKRAGRPHHRSSSSRSSGHGRGRSRRCGRACWRARSRARCSAAAFWRPRSRA